MLIQKREQLNWGAAYILVWLEKQDVSGEIMGDESGKS